MRAGGSGTGKSVAALHDAVWLARTGRVERILVTTFVDLLPKVWGASYDVIAPDVRERIEAAAVDSLARGLGRDAGDVLGTVTDAERRVLLERALNEVPEAGAAPAGGRTSSEPRSTR